jgi:hypothetical protein
MQTVLMNAILVVLNILSSANAWITVLGIFGPAISSNVKHCGRSLRGFEVWHSDKRMKNVMLDKGETKAALFPLCVKRLRVVT